MLLCLSVWLVYRPGLSGPFVFDDFPNITGNRFIAIDRLSADKLMGAAFSDSDSSGLLSRPIPRATFALNYYFAGRAFEPYAFKLTNLAIHAANTVLVYLLLTTLFSLAPAGRLRGDETAVRHRAVMIAALSAALWALHPLNLSSVLYAVQRMNSMSALFVLAGLLVFVHGRVSLLHNVARGTAFMAGGLIGGISLGFLCKENAVLLPLFAAVTELVFFSRDGLPAATRWTVRVFYLLFLGLPMLAAGIYVLLNPDFLLGSYAMREFSMTERLLTESRVLFFYLSLIAFPSIPRFGFYHDDFPLSIGLLTPPSTLIALLAWCLILALLIGGLRRRAVWAFGLAWFVAGHLLESTLIGLEIVHEHRNYVPGIGICAAAAYYLTVLFERVRSRAGLVFASCLCVLLGIGFVTHTRAGIWSTRVSLYESMVRHHPDSYRALAGLAITMMEQQRDARDIYRMYRDAALANQASVYPLVWMERILQALISTRPASEGAGNESSHADPVEILWNADPVLNRGYLVMLDQALSREIEERLANGKPHVETVHALTTAQSCLLSGRSDCTPLRAKLLEWHFIVLSRLPPWGPSRAKLELSIAKLYAERGDLGKAEEFVDRSISSAGVKSSYRFQKALLLIKLGKLEQAGQIADTIERGMGWRRTYADHVEYLRREIRRAESTAESS